MNNMDVCVSIQCVCFNIMCVFQNNVCVSISIGLVGLWRLQYIYSAHTSNFHI